MRDPDRGHFDPHGGVCDPRLSSRGGFTVSRGATRDPRLDDDVRRVLLLTPVVVEACRVAGNDEEDEEGGSDERASVSATSQDEGPVRSLAVVTLPSSPPLTSAARFRPPRASPSDFLLPPGIAETPATGHPLRDPRARAPLLPLPASPTHSSPGPTLVRQLSMSRLMFPVGRVNPRLHRVHRHETRTTTVPTDRRTRPH